MSLPPPTLPAKSPNFGATTCAWHPDRATGRSCTRCGKPACPDCLTPAAVGSHCRDCVRAARPPAATRAKNWDAAHPILATQVLIAMNVAFYVYGLATSSGSRGGGGGGLGLSSGISSWHVRYGLTKSFVAQGEWWRLITSGFVHFGLFHIGMNMFILFQLGRILEPALGRTKFVAVYFASLLAGSVGVLLLEPNALAGGASGAVFGLLGAAAIGMHRRGVNVLRTGIGTTILLNLVITFTIPGISIGAHMGGLVGGALCGWALLAPTPRTPAAKWALAAPAAVAALSVIAALTIARGA